MLCVPGACVGTRPPLGNKLQCGCIIRTSASGWRLPTMRFCLAPLPAAGALEVLFVLEDECDAAHAAVKELVGGAGRRLEARIVLSGRATATSQKIHK